MLLPNGKPAGRNLDRSFNGNVNKALVGRGSIAVQNLLFGRIAVGHIDFRFPGGIFQSFQSRLGGKTV